MHQPKITTGSRWPQVSLLSHTCPADPRSSQCCSLCFPVWKLLKARAKQSADALMLGSQDTMCAHPQPEPLPDPASPGLSPTGSSLLTVAGEKGARRRHQQPRLSPAGSFSTCQLLHSSLPCIPPTPKFSEATFLLYLSW